MATTNEPLAYTSGVRIPQARGRAFRKSLIVFGKAVVGLAVLAALYQLVRTLGWLPQTSTASLQDIAVAGWKGFADGTLGAAILTTLQAWFFGLLIATVAGTIVGVACGMWWPVDASLSTTIDFLRPIPAVALIPLAIILYGIQLPMQVFLTALASSWPIIIASRHAVRNTDPLWRDVAMISGTRPLGIIARVVAPASIPGIVTGIRTGSAIAILVAVSSEIVSGSPGLGSFITANDNARNTGAVFAATIIAGLLGVVLDSLLRIVERLVASWQESSTEGRRA